MHFAGGCWRLPGEHYKVFIDLGHCQPNPEEVDARCVDCFPPEKRQKDEVPAGESASDTSSSSSSIS